VKDVKGNFQFREDGLYYIDRRKGEHKVIRSAIVANGVRDLCIAWKGPKKGDINIMKISDADPKHILDIPKGDILWLRINPPFCDRVSMFMDVADPDVKEMADMIFQRFPKGVKGKDYEMYGGGEYR
jgi:hypothetical protein